MTARRAGPHLHLVVDGEASNLPAVPDDTTTGGRS
jgi:hypothetical protein